MYISNMTIMTPSNSPNTDAMDILETMHIFQIIAIKPNAYNMTIKNIYCGLGHGTSIGSVGEDD